MQPKIKVVMADDSALMRREIKKIIEADGDIEVIGVAHNGAQAVELVQKLHPDVVTLDINMPEMDGLTALQYIMMQFPCPCIMVSSLTQAGALTTYEALELGAVDYISKPDGTISMNIEKRAQQIRTTIRSAAMASIKKIKKTKRPHSVPKPQPVRSFSKDSPFRVAFFGQSTGGPNTIVEILPFIEYHPNVSLLIVQHMPSGFTKSFAERLSTCSGFEFVEIENQMPFESGKGYVAPGDIHTVLKRRGSQLFFELTPEPRDSLHAPSVDVTLESVSEIYRQQLVATILTGMGSDGALAMRDAMRNGAKTIAESEDTAVVFGMPKEAIALGGIEYVLPSHQIGKKVNQLLNSLARELRKDSAS